MTTIEAFIKRHPVLAFYALVFAISWGGILLVVGPGGIPAANKGQFETLLPIAILAMVAGPSVAGILLTGLVYGKAGLREFLSRLLRWRVGARWYAVALLTAPLAFTAVCLVLSLTSSEFLPGILTSDDKASVLLMGIFAGLVAGIFEELGWTGFATPTLLGRMRYGILATGLIVGVPWAVWHLLVAFWASLTASSLILGPGVAGVRLVSFDLAWAAVLWAVVAAVAVAQGGHLSRHPPLPRRVV